ncbi:GTPase SAR1 [Pseudomonas aeruginosa]|nr:GTPase SAR1 [Pseudomonas aeruginosa]
MTEPLILAVVGHTNTGKTSLLRTLTRDRGFGEVSHRPSTTRHVEGARLSVDGEALLELYDTPGLEDAIALLDYLDALERPGERLDGPERMARLLDSNEARGRFEQEAKVVRQLLASDAGLYVIDAREPVLAKYRDELAVLAGCGRPLLPVLNFVASPQHREEEWRAALARLGLHALVRFDSVAPPLDGERRLYESLALLLERARPQLDRLIADHETQAAARLRAGQRLIAELLVDVAACRRLVPGGESAVQEATRDLHQQVRKREPGLRGSVAAALRLRQGRRPRRRPAAARRPLGRRSVQSGDPAPTRYPPRRRGCGRCRGRRRHRPAGGRRHPWRRRRPRCPRRRRLADRRPLWLAPARQAQGRPRADRQPTPCCACSRCANGQLLAALQTRGHAAVEAIRLETPEDKQWARKASCRKRCAKARAHPEWSSLNGRRVGGSDRQEQIDALAELLESGRGE